MKQVILDLTVLDIILLSIALISLFGNLFQFMIWWRDKKKFYNPVFSALVALFNDIKSKTNNVYIRQQLLYNTKNPHEKLETLKWEFYEFTSAVIGYLQGFQETVVGVLVTLNPEDKEGKESFSAANYGLTEEEKNLRKAQLEKILEQTRISKSQ